MLKILFLAAVLYSSLFAMHSMELNINEKDLEAKLLLDIGQYNETIDPDTTFMGVSYLAGTQEHSSEKSDPRGLLCADFFIQRAVSGFEDLVLGMGAKFTYTSTKSNNINYSFFALPFGLMANYRLPISDVIPFFIVGEGYYSPEVLSFGDAKNYVELNTYLEIQLIDRGSIVGGYRNIETNYSYSGGNIRLNESWYAGFKFLF